MQMHRRVLPQPILSAAALSANGAGFSDRISVGRGSLPYIVFDFARFVKGFSA
jgi:hypothetical protein